MTSPHTAESLTDVVPEMAGECNLKEKIYMCLETWEQKSRMCTISVTARAGTVILTYLILSIGNARFKIDFHIADTVIA